MSDGFDFLGFHIQWRRKRGSNKWYVYTFIAKRPIRQLKDKIRALTNRTSQQDPGTVLIEDQPDPARLGQLLQARGVQDHLEGPGPVRMATGDQLVDGAASLEVEGRPPTLHRPQRPVAQALGGRDRTVPHGLDRGHPLPIPGQHDPQPLDTQPRLNGRDRGEPGAVRAARRVRRAARRNGPVATPAPRSVPTQQRGRSAAMRSIGSSVPSRSTNAFVDAARTASARVGARAARRSTASVT